MRTTPTSTLRRFTHLAFIVLLTMSLIVAFMPVMGNAKTVTPTDSASGVQKPNLASSYGHIPEGITPRSIHDANESVDLTAQAALPTSYSSLDAGYVTPTKDQGAFGICWSYASIAAMESSLMRRNGISSPDLSERHLAYFTYHTAVDPLGGTQGDSTTPVGEYADTPWFDGTGDPYLVTGGNALLVTGTLSKWAGVAEESLAPMETLFSAYEPVDEMFVYGTANREQLISARNAFTASTALPTAEAYTRDAYHLEQMRLIPITDRDDVKQAIVDYGALSQGVYMDERFYNAQTHAYYNWEVSTGNHDVAIVGWDDSYPASNFATSQPGQNGAWLAKNSWGTSFGDNGFFWISYEDLSMQSEPASAFELADADNFDHNYQYDGAFGFDFASTLASGGSIANVFTADANKGGIEQLAAVSLALPHDVNVDYSVQVYAGLTNASNPTSGRQAFATPVTGKTSYAGYYTIEFPNPVHLVEGSKYSVVITLSHADGSRVLYSTDMTYGNGEPIDSTDTIRYVSSVSGGQSFARDNDAEAWFDLANEEAYNEGNEIHCVARIKAFTNDVTHVDLSECTMRLAVNQAGQTTYHASACMPSIVITHPSTGDTWEVNSETAASLGLELDYANNVNAGEATVTATSVGDSVFMEGSSNQVTFGISRADIANATIAPIADQQWTGQEIMPSLAITHDGRTLAEGVDYSVSYANNIEAGTATVDILGLGNYEGAKTVSFQIVPPQEGADTTQVMYRLYNPNSGEHFYTASVYERNQIIAAGWNDEGEGWIAPVASGTPVYRLYSGTDHHYTTSAYERNALIAVGWRDEGVGWYSDDAQDVALFRLFNPYVDPNAPTNNSGSHNYTTSTVERDHLVSVGWHDEGIGWYGVR